MPIYRKAIANAFGGEIEGESYNIDYLTDTMKVALCSDTYSPLQDNHEFFSSITGEVTGTGYTASGATLGTKTITFVTSSVFFGAANVTWANSTITARYAVIYKVGSSPATSPLFGYIDFGSNKQSSDGDFTLQWSGGNIFRVDIP
jgi:hypothetical protein